MLKHYFTDFCRDIESFCLVDSDYIFLLSLFNYVYTGSEPCPIKPATDLDGYSVF